MVQDQKKLPLIQNDSLGKSYSSNSTMTNPTLHIIKNRNATSFICCICCIDPVSRLSKDERLIMLSCGFIRESTCKFVPDEIILLCVQFVGSELGAGLSLDTHGEIKTRKKKVIITGWDYRWGYCDCCANCLTDIYCCFGYGVEIMYVLFFILILAILGIMFGKEIASLVVLSYHDCNITGGNDRVSFDVNQWILVGAVCNISIYTAALCFFGCRYQGEKVENQTTDSDIFVLSGPICMPCCCCFQIAWMVIGFLLYGEMINDANINDECKNMVLSWNVLQAIQVTFLPCLVWFIMAIPEDFWNRFAKAFKEYEDGLLGLAVVTLIMLSAVMVYGKDVAGFIIWSEYDCNINHYNGGNLFVFLDVNEWLEYGCIVHLSAWVGLLILFCCFFGDDCFNCMQPNFYLAVAPCVAGLGLIFNTVWMVIGFLLYSDMVPDESIANRCKDMVLSWSVLQVIETLAVSCLLCFVGYNYVVNG